jgi:hypothetical protein
MSPGSARGGACAPRARPRVTSIIKWFLALLNGWFSHQGTKAQSPERSDRSDKTAKGYSAGIINLLKFIKIKKFHDFSALCAFVPWCENHAFQTSKLATNQ